MRLEPGEFDEVFGAVQEYGRLEYRAGVAQGQEARTALKEAYTALGGLKELLGLTAPEGGSQPDPAIDHRAAAREHVLANRELAGEPGDLARECLAWIASYRTDMDAQIYRECVLGGLDGYRQLSAPPNPWAAGEALPRPR
jgi:hypothetical protein